MDEAVTRDFDVLREAVEDVFDISIRERTRKRQYVNGRFVFANILIGRGHTKVDVARYLGINHATVCHYCRNFYGFTQADKRLRDNYYELDKLFKGQFNPLYRMDRVQLRDRVMELEDRLRSVERKSQDLRERMLRLKQKAERLQPIWNVIEDRVPKGREDEVRRKVNTVLNGIHG